MWTGVFYCDIHPRRLLSSDLYFQLLWIGSNWNSIYVESDHFLFFFYIFLLCTHFLWNISSYSSARSKTIRQINIYLYRLIFFCVTKQHQILYQSSTKLSMFRLNCLCLHCLHYYDSLHFNSKHFFSTKKEINQALIIMICFLQKFHIVIIFSVAWKNRLSVNIC